MIDIRNLTYSYEADGKKHTVLKNVSLQIKKGELVAVLGHNGSGKSTLAKHINAILLPDEGSVTVDGLDTADEKNIYAVRQKAGMVFQNPDNQMVSSVIEDDVAFAPENLGVPREEIRKRVDYALKAVGMYKEREKAPRLLSGGQKQRVAIAGIIAMQPEYIILDEATAMLDPSGRREVMDTVIRLNREKGITVIMITHFMEEAALADRLIVLNNGEKAFDGIPEKLFSDSLSLKRLELCPPAATELLQMLRERGLDVPSYAESSEKCISYITECREKRHNND